jgi:hypothetical protein
MDGQADAEMFGLDSRRSCGCSHICRSGAGEPSHDGALGIDRRGVPDDRFLSAAGRPRVRGTDPRICDLASLPQGRGTPPSVNDGLKMRRKALGRGSRGIQPGANDRAV